MGKIGKITPEQLKTARRLLRELPVKDTRCSCEEAAAFLEKDLKRAFRKGYTPKELCVLLKKAGIIIPEPLIARYQEPVVENRGNRVFVPERILGPDVRNYPVPHRQTVNTMVAKGITPSAENEVAVGSKTEPIRYWESILIGGTQKGKTRRESPLSTFGRSKEGEEKGDRFLTQIWCHVKPVSMGEQKMAIAME